MEHLHREDHFDDAEHQRNLDSLEEQFHRNNFGPRCNVHLSVRPATLECAEEVDADNVAKDGQRFTEEYEADCQFVFSRVQHHWHKLGKDGSRHPMRYCQTRRKGQSGCCKAGFPKKVLRDKTGKVRAMKYRVRIVCSGVAQEMDVRTSGRRNMLGAVMGRRQCEWFSGTSAILAHLTRSNTNVQCPYRIPINEHTHDPDCTSKRCANLDLKKLCLVAQRAMKNISGYFGGYISKRQKMGQFELKTSIKALPLMKQKLEARKLKRGSAQLAHVVNRMFTTLESKGILRSAPEEFMLSALYRPHDVLAAEFFRTCRHEFFFGKQMLGLYDACVAQDESRVATMKVSSNTRRKMVTDAESVYGFRPCHSDMWYLSPWEFCQWFKAIPLRPPSADVGQSYSKWTPAGKQKLRDKFVGALEPGIDYVFDFAKIQRTGGVYAYPQGKDVYHETAPETYTSFRENWILIRRTRPMVPCPEDTPLPNRRVSKEARAKRLSVYLRPWTLSKKMCTEEVPHLADLGRTSISEDMQSGDAPLTATSSTELTFRDKWKKYLGRVWPHSERGVQSFLLTCLAEGRGGDDDEENNRAKGQAVVCNLTVAGVHEAVALSEVRTEENIVSKQVLETAKRAVALTRLNVMQHSHAASAGKIGQRHMLVPAQVKDNVDLKKDEVLSWTASTSLAAWINRYDRWAYEVFDNPESVSPTQEQAEVLKVVHNRVTQEEYELGRTATVWME